MKAGLYMRIAISMAVVLAIVSVSSWRSFYFDTISSSFLSVALLSLLVILLRTRFVWMELAAVAALAGVIALLDLKVLRYPGGWQVWISFLGLASLAFLAVRVVWDQGEPLRTSWLTLIPAFLFVASEWFADYFLAWTEHAHPKVLDLFLYSFDASLHLQIAFLMGQMFASSLAFTLVSLLFYLGLPIVIALTFAACAVRDRRQAVSAFLAFFLTGPIGAIFYNLYPAMGPKHVFGKMFPWHPLPIEQASRLFLEPVAGHGARNAMPSLHAAWVFLALWYARKLTGLERVVAALFVAFTLFATVGLGEHYFVDLVVAAPFSVFMLALANLPVKRDKGLLLPLIVGLGTTLAWFAALRYAIRIFWISPLFPWGACVVTVMLSLYMLRYLEEPVSGAQADQAKLEEVASVG